jgi:excisionase family DNA binding protein
MPEPRWLTPSEAAQRLGMSASGVRWMVDTGRVRPIRTANGRRLVSLRDLDRVRVDRARRRGEVATARTALVR